VYTEGARVERAFVAGASHEILVSVGRQATIGLREAFPEPTFPDEVDRLELIVRLCVGTELQEEVLSLPRDASRESGHASFHVDVPAEVRNFSALVSVYHGAVLLQGAVLQGAVVADRAAERAHDGAIELQIAAWVHPLGDTPRSKVEASFVTDGRQGIAATGRGAVAVDVTTLAEEVGSLWRRLEVAADLLYGGAGDELDHVLRDMAIHGRRLRARFVQGLPEEVRNATHLQAVSADPAAILPLELVYDAPQPSTSSPVCSTWHDAVASGLCGGCDGGGPEGDVAAGLDARVCPMRFWGLSKVIEHHAGLAGGSGSFEVRSSRSAAAGVLPPLHGAVVGASELVEAADVSATADAASAAFGWARTATTWREWSDIVATERPSVLIALPHHAMDGTVDPPAPALEMGQALLPAGGVEPRHVGAGSDVGPIVLLLGCNTGWDDTPLDTFAGEFRMQGASFVVSTLVQVIATEAPAAARLLIEAMSHVDGAASVTVGDALLRARRSLLAERLVFGLAVVGHGDPDWLLS
jgi:hypothetical protein